VLLWPSAQRSADTGLDGMKGAIRKAESGSWPRRLMVSSCGSLTSCQSGIHYATTGRRSGKIQMGKVDILSLA